MDFDLIELIGQQYYTYVDETVSHHPAASCSKGDTGITASTLRRKLFDQESNFVGGSGDTEDVGCGDDDDGGLRLPTMSSSKLPDTPGMKLIAFRLCTRHKHDFLSEFQSQNPLRINSVPRRI